MEQTFTCQGKTWTRRNIPGVPVKIVRVESESRYCPTDSVIWSGAHILNNGETEITVERSTVTDAGHLGKSLTYTETHTRAERAVSLDRVLAGMGYRCGA